MIKRKRLRKITFLFIALVITLPLVYFLFVPDISRLKKENPRKTSLMEYREREWQEKGIKYRIHKIWVPLARVSPYLVKAVLIAEDDKFWRHEGFDYKAIQKAMEKDIKARKFKLGGSTISQQLAKNLYLSPSKNPLRKIAEAIITWRMERVLSKKRILELYLNVVEWGEGIFGVEAASRHYYGKSSSELTPEEASRLAAVLPNPRKYNPVSDQRYVVNRSNLIYSIMVKRGIVVPEYEEVTEESESPPPSVPVEEQNPSK
ncbi:MAG: monofunctional biosynthetic peptidoglycan transglycosylase [Nitrospira sp.]|nr:monofunctional biosynthetic peptidoglycan transglycosylase [Nitrospira sp.]